MSYTPKDLKSGGGIIGKATIKMDTSGKMVKVIYGEDNDNKSVVLPKKDCPANIAKGEWIVRSSADGKKVYSVSPVNGQFVVKVASFVADKDKPPAPKTHVGQNWSYEYFTVVLEITKGSCAGMSISYRLHYHFGEDEEGNVAFSHGKSKYTPLLKRFCDLAGVWERGPMKYSDNVLPNMEKRILRAEKEFRVEMVDGWVDRLYPIADLKDDAEDEDADFDKEDSEDTSESMPWSDEEDSEDE